MLSFRVSHEVGKRRSMLVRAAEICAKDDVTHDRQFGLDVHLVRRSLRGHGDPLPVVSMPCSLFP
jgi:hypothetical protein